MLHGGGGVVFFAIIAAQCGDLLKSRDRLCVLC